MNDVIFENLFLYQRDHVERMGRSFDECECIIDPSDTGTGKTPSMSALAKWKERNVFVICPKPVIPDWFRWLNVFSVKILGIANYEAVKNGKYYETIEMYNADVRVGCPFINLVKTDDDETDFEWDLPVDAMIIVDEAHKGKNHITINSQLLVSMKKVIAINGPRLTILSATITDKVENFRVAAHLLGMSQYGKHAYRIWLRRIAQQYPNMTPVEAIHKILYPKYGHRMRICDIKADNNPEINTLFKENDVRAEVFEISPEKEKLIEDAYHDIHEALKIIKTKQEGETCFLTIILRARQRIEMLKIDLIILLVMEYLLNGFSVVIFVNFNDTITSLFQALDDFVQKEFGSFIAFVHGDQSTKDRQYNINAFQTDRARLMIANIRAGGVGVSFHDTNGNFPRVSLISPTWSSIDLKQVLGRIYRANAKSNAVQRIIFTKGKVSSVGAKGYENDTTFKNEDTNVKIGVEEMIARNVNKKLRTIERLNNGDLDNLLEIREDK